MGGYGSGVYHRPTSKRVVEECRSLDIRYLSRSGLLKQGKRFDCHWSSRGRETGRIAVYANSRNNITLSLAPNWIEEWERTEQHIPITWTVCHFGGERPWFVCPVYREGEHCGRRVAKLYAGRDLFACRHCLDLSYQTQREPRYGRALLKAQGIREKLGGSLSTFDQFPERPKGMHWRTYLRLQESDENAQAEAWAGWL